MVEKPWDDRPSLVRRDGSAPVVEEPLLSAETARPRESTRDQIVAAADDLFYRNGYENTSFADIAAAVGISRGNFYHHFKSKDDILDAVIARRAAGTKAMLAEWEQAGTGPEDRIRSYIRILIRNQDLILRFGCPVGTLCAELAKLDHAAQAAARRIFTLFRDWLRAEFERLGRRDADALAMETLAWSQGVATLASALTDAAFIAAEVARREAWLAAVADRAIDEGER